MTLKVAYFQPTVVAAGPVPPADFVKIYNLTEDIHTRFVANDVNDPSFNIRGGQQVTLYPNNSDIDYTWLVNLIEEMCKGYMDLVSTQTVTTELNYCEPKVVSIRTTRQTSGDYTEMHTHPAGNLSGNIYASVPDYDANKLSSDGTLSLRLPHTRDLTRFIMQDTWKFQPEPGTFVLFPSHIPHSVNPWKGQGSRTVLSFDIVLVARDLTNGQS